MAIDAHVERWFRDALAGHVDRTFLRGDLNQKLTDERLADITALARYGTLTTFTFTHSLRREPITSYYYFAIFAHRALIVLAEVDDSGQMSNITIANGDPVE